MTGRERLLQVAPLLWGKRWQTAMQEELRVNRRTLSRYLHGREVAPRLLFELDRALLARLDAIVEALDVPESLKAGVRIEVDEIKGFLKGSANAAE